MMPATIATMASTPASDLDTIRVIAAHPSRLQASTESCGISATTIHARLAATALIPAVNETAALVERESVGVSSRAVPCRE